MGVAKAALDSSVQYLAWDLGEKNVRVNAISAGPVRTLAARSIAGFPTMEAIVEERAPLRRPIDADDVGAAAAYLLSDEARNVTATTLYVDSGYHSMGMKRTALTRAARRWAQSNARFVLDNIATRRVESTRMLLAPVEYARPSSVDEAVRLLAAHDGARALAGGQTLTNVMKARAAAPDVLVDLNDLAELRALSRSDDGGLELGAMVTLSELIRSPEVGEARPILATVASQIADVQVRNRGTIGGNICSNDPTNHLPPVVAALGATMSIRGADGERTIGAEEFFLGVYMTAVQPGELLTRIVIPPAEGARDAFTSVPIGKDGTCIVNAAATVRDGQARIALGCVAAVPLLVTSAAEEAAVRQAVQAAGLDPPSDVHASADYRRHLAEVVAVRAVQEATA
jgi:carbon-monoxide dehydrogenase medium subunit